MTKAELRDHLKAGYFMDDAFDFTPLTRMLRSAFLIWIPVIPKDEKNWRRKEATSTAE